VSDLAPGGALGDRAAVMQQKTGRPVSFEITEPTRDALVVWLNRPEGWSFKVKEVSAGVYCVTGVGPGGVSVERTGTDEEALLLEMIRDAESLGSPR
jgi:hypothetical protein